MRQCAPRFFLPSAALLLALVVACSAGPPTLARSVPSPSIPAARSGFTLTSDDFVQGGIIPKLFTCDGENKSPELKWGPVPAGTRSFTLIMEDPDAPGGTFTHWVAFDIPPTVTELPEGAQTIAKGGLNGTGKLGYTGPCPPSGTHRYVFTLYALDIPSLSLANGAARTEVTKALMPHVAAEAQLTARYSR